MTVSDPLTGLVEVWWQAIAHVSGPAEQLSETDWSADREPFALLAGGRRTRVPGSVAITGDAGPARQLVGRLAVTP